jgi:TonB family protein
MPLNVRRFVASFFLVVFSFIVFNAQTVPTSGEVMRGRISKAKALIAVRNYNAAIYELETIRRETSDQTVHSVTSVLLMNCYLELSDYKRAQEFLGTLYNDFKSNKPNAASNYYAAAGQVIKSARNQSERYKSLGLSVSDRNLPPEALNDLEKMRETIEKVVEQSKLIAKDSKQTSNAFALLEEASNARSTLARDDFDARRWQDEVADSREMLANSRSTVLNATNETEPNQITQVSSTTVASNENKTVPTTTLPVPNENEISKTSTPVFKPVSTETKTNPVNEQAAKIEKKEEPKKTEEKPKVEEKTVAENSNNKRERRVDVKENNKDENATVGQSENSNSNEPLNVGSLLEYAVEKKNPIYPPTARTLRQTGVVKVELLIDENGQVAAVQNMSGPTLLQSAAKDAVRKWKFKPFVRDGQPVKATGYLSFNFNL